MKLKVLLLALVFILIFNIAYAIGINPGITNTEYSPGQTIDGVYKLVNKENVPKTVTLTTKGDLAKYLTIPETKITVPANGEYQTSFSLVMPKGLAPGKYDTRIHIAESSNGEKFGLAFAVEYVIVFDAPYQGKHVSPSIMLGGATTGNLVISAGLANDGTEAVQSSSIEVLIINSIGASMFSASEDAGAIDVKQFTSKLFQADKTNWPEGNYTIKLSAVYDGTTASLSQEFSTITSVPQQQTIEIKLNQTATQPTKSDVILSEDKTITYVTIGAIIIIIIAFLAIYFARRKSY